jgi:hypothetical protein
LSAAGDRKSGQGTERQQRAQNRMCEEGERRAASAAVNDSYSHSDSFEPFLAAQWLCKVQQVHN